jgi:hypothetical protein
LARRYLICLQSSLRPLVLAPWQKSAGAAEVSKSLKAFEVDKK